MANGQNTELLIGAIKLIREYGPVVYPALRQIVSAIRERDGITSEEAADLQGTLSTDPALVGMKGRIPPK